MGRKRKMVANRIEEDVLVHAYRVMKRIRTFETRISKEFAAGTVPGMTHLYIGQEAVAAGVCAHLTDNDYTASTHRGHGHAIAKGAEIRGMALELFRKGEGVCKGKGCSMHIADVSRGMLGANAIVGGAAPLAIGAALSAKLRAKGNMAVAFAGDGATNQGTTFEAMNMAVVLNLPVLFAIENNGYGEHTGNEYATGADITKRTKGFGLPCERVDGTDFFEVYDAMERVVNRARTGKGPSAIEAVAMRWHGHFEGDPQNYRDKREIEKLRKTADPLVKFLQRVEADRLIDLSILAQVDEAVTQEVSEAVDYALQAPPPNPAELLTDVYGSY